MSEKLYALLFRLYPARFRTAWGEEAVQLFQDRLGNERGPRARLRLWLDILADLGASVPRTYLQEQPSVPAASAQSDRVPSFHLVEYQPISSRAYFFASVLSILLLVGAAVMINRGGRVPILRPSAAEEAGWVTLDPWATGRGSGSGSGPEAIGNGSRSSGNSHSTNGNSRAVLVHVHSNPTPLFDDAERDRVLDGVIANLEQHDPDADAARRAAVALRADEALGRYRSVGDPDQFAAMVTSQIRHAASDLHLKVEYSARPLPVNPVAFSPADEARFRASLLSSGCGFADVRTLPGGIGYLKLDLFPPVDACGDAAIAAMKTVSRANALIIDLRDNSGGDPDMVMLLGGRLFDKPVFFYNPRENDAAHMWTHSPVTGSGLAGKPVWLLTSSRTYSAAEHFSYNLKMLHRATLVGETTGGATDVGVFHRIDDHFGIGISESRVPNPYPAPDWAVNGVQPDVRVPAADALAVAEKLAAQKLASR